MNYIREIINLIGHDSLMKGRTYPSEYIKHIKTEFKDGKYIHNYQVESQSTVNTYNVEIINNGGKIYNVKCNCPQFINKNTCKHLGAVFFEDIDRIYEHEHIDSTYISREILDYFCDTEEYNIKTKLNLEVEFIINETNVALKLLIGDTKLYTLSQEAKLIDFMYAFKNKKEYKFGKQFTYNAKKHYFDTIDIDILNHINSYEKNTGYYYHTNPFTLSFREFESFIKIFKDKKITVNSIKIDKIIYELPTKYILNKKENYQLYLNEQDKYIYLNNTNKYILYNNTLCIPNDNDIRFLTQLKNNKMDKLVFNDNDINKFSKGLFNKIKNNIEIDDDISLKLPIKPKVNLYFDINDILTCKLILDYKNISINYFDNIDILRDNEYEENVIKDLINNGLYIKNNQFIIENEDEIYDFISDKINTLSKSYNIYTSKKIDNTKILKNTSSNNNFNLGNSILEYNFSIEGIDTKEFNNIYKSLKRNKRYYKLNNDTIIKLEDNEGLNTINNIIDDLEINYNDIKNGSIALPKYQALYIDSLKKNKYKINTNNLFDNFIDNFKKYKDADIVFDKNDDILRDYQKEGVKWLYTIYKCGFGGILADEMGLGKSIQTISFIRKIIKENTNAKIMIVSPTSLVYNWEKEFNKFGSDLKYIVVMDNKNKRKEILSNKDNYNIFITTYGLIRNDNDEYENIDFEVCIIDEAQTIKNYQSNMTREVKKIKSKCKIALTGTPLENNVIELWSIFDFIMPGYLNNLPKFKDKYNIKDITNDELKVLKDLNYLITPFILRRKKIDVLKSLPDKIVSEVYVELPDKQKLLYLKELEDTKEELDNVIKIDGFNKSRIKVLQLLTRLRQLCIDPYVLFENYDGDNIKLDTLIDIVKENINSGHKILIFSSFKRILLHVKDLFDINGITNYMIDGTVKSKERMNLVEKFNNDDTNCFLITLKSGGTGLNLTGADTVIHLDIWWNPAVEDQATDRAHRIGQKNTVNVIKIVTKGTIEEKILELQNKKKVLSENLINGMETEILSNLEEDDIYKLLSTDK